MPHRHRGDCQSINALDSPRPVSASSLTGSFCFSLACDWLAAQCKHGGDPREARSGIEKFAGEAGITPDDWARRLSTGGGTCQEALVAGVCPGAVLAAKIMQPECCLVRMPRLVCVCVRACVQLDSCCSC